MRQKPEGVLSLDLVRVNPEGWPFIAIFALVAFILFFVWEPLGWLGVLATVWCVFFFRDPERVTPVRPGLLVAPADGIVMQIVPASPPRELGMGDEPRTRISIFLNVFDVHVNRMPGDGRVVQRAYRPGKFINASLDKASEDNERLALRVRLDSSGPQGPADIAVVQIAGLIARRIRCWVAEG
ncbi:MAG TPA: phosphatidylserine decarboxylase, partial [Sphingomicrobium sp.]|nr:phosphatidylserine decarboxylase [Sphingomicrobium sp.]